jgi:CRISPR-associated endonuclease Csn1
MANYVLGLDLGPNSIGWAMLAVDPATDEVVGLYDSSYANHPPLGVRVFEAGLDNFDTAKEMSRNQARRTARSMRRNHARRNARRREIRDLLAGAGLLPPAGPEQDELFKTDPYLLRARGLTEDLTAHELGRALFHLGQRRGFRSNRKGGESKEDEGILLEIGQLEKAIQEAGRATLGHYLHHLARSAQDPHRPRLRARHTRRDMYTAEFQALVARQRKVHGTRLTDELVDKLADVFFYQHPFEITEERRAQAPSRANLHRAPSVRPCPLERGERCCPKGDWHAQQFRILKEVANLRISEHNREERALTPGERNIVLGLLSVKDKVKFDELRKALAKAGCDPAARFNLERGERKGLLGNSVEHKLIWAFGKGVWPSLEDFERARLRDLVVHEEDVDAVRAAILKYELGPDKTDRLAKWNPADGYLGYSLKAILKLLPALEAGQDECAAIQQAYPDRPEAVQVDRLPPLSAPELPPNLADLTNPIVRRALVEVRKVVNALVREHGLPTRIVVELAREMKDGAKARKEAGARNREREALRARAADRVAELGGNRYSRSDINRWLFWEEQGGECLYTGRAIPVSELFGGEWEVDHILPRWRSLDDSMMNKALVHRSANAEKRDRTPAEWLGADSEAYDQLLRRADSLVRANRLPGPKFARLALREMSADSFSQRQLNDTRYLTVATVQYLSLLFPPEMRVGEKGVLSCRGGLTAELRRQWGLNSILPPLHNADGQEVMSEERDADGNPLKSRADHRHHAIDAVVVALSSRPLLKRYQDYWKRRDSLLPGQRPEFPTPWESLRSDIQFAASQIVVSHRAQKKIAGAFHEETFYGAARDRSGALLAERFVTRKPLAMLTGSMVEQIRDDAVRRLVTDRLTERGWDGKSAALPKDWHKDLVMASGVPVRRVRIEKVLRNTARLGHRHAELGNNHHMEIVASAETDKDGGPRQMWASVVPTLEVAKRVRRESLSPVQREHGDGRRLIMSLARKESVRAVNMVTGEWVVCVVQMLSGTNELSQRFDMVLRDARDSRAASTGNKSPFKRIVSFSALRELRLEKLQVDPLGRTHPSND